MAIGKKLEVILQAKGIKPGTLATMTGINKNTIYSIIKRDNDKVSMEMLTTFADALDISVDYFFDKGVDQMTNSSDEIEPASLNGLNAKERRFVNAFTALTPQNRHTLLVIAEALLRDQGEHPDTQD